MLTDEDTPEGQLKPKDAADLRRIYMKAEEADKELFAEMRSNILLIAGEHYSRVNARVASQIRQANKTPLAQEQKLRLTKNHMHKIHRSYMQSILAEAPGTTILPKHDTELQDQKEAELNKSVWEDMKARHKLKGRIRNWCRDLIGVGEVAVKMFWDPNTGQLKGYHPQVDENGEPIMQPTGKQVPTGQMKKTGNRIPTGQVDGGGERIMQDEMQPEMTDEMVPVDDKTQPIFVGDNAYEDVYGFNLLREAGTRDMMADKDRAWIIRKMVDTKELRYRYREKPDIVAKIHDDANETFIIFDANKGSYNKVKDQCMVCEYYYEPCTEYPEGYFYYATKSVILEEGVIPEGIWPLAWAGFDKHPTTPRARSILKQARPYQAEINRASSSMAVAQITLGDDKVLYQAGAKLSPGALLPGVRGIAYQGQAPTVLPGRNGAQYLEYVEAQVKELYDITDMPQDAADTSGQIDPYVLLYRAASQRKKYSLYIDVFDDFLCQITETSLKIARAYYPDDMLVMAIGRREQVNIPEFRGTSPLGYKIKVEPESETLETQLGRQLTFQHILQYVGSKLDPSTMGKVIKNSPFSNYNDSFDELTIDQTMADNDMLALERGKQVKASQNIKPDFMMKQLTNRMKKPDFDFLPQPVQQNYNSLNQQYEQMAQQAEQKLQALKNDFIPVDGALVTCDFYLPPKNPQEQSKRAKIPQRAIEWLLQRLQEQGMSMDQMEGMNAKNLSDMAQMLLNKGQAQAPGQAGGPSPQGMPPRPQGMPPQNGSPNGGQPMLPPAFAHAPMTG